MNSSILLYPIILPLIGGIICFLIPTRKVKEAISIGITLVVFILALLIFLSKELFFTHTWLSFLGIDFSLRSYSFSSFILLFVSLFSFLISLYSARFMADKFRTREYYSYLLLTASCAPSSDCILCRRCGTGGEHNCVLAFLGNSGSSPLCFSFPRLFKACH